MIQNMSQLKLNNLYRVKWDDEIKWDVIAQCVELSGELFFNDLKVMIGNEKVNGWRLADTGTPFKCQDLGPKENHPEYFL